MIVLTTMVLLSTKDNRLWNDKALEDDKATYRSMISGNMFATYAMNQFKA
jgi:hypothetical protein